MIERIRKKYAMTEKGAKDYVAAVFWSVLVNISKMLPVGVLATALSGIVEALTNGTDPRAGLTRFLVAGVLALTALFVTFLIQYKALYEATYRESANRRIRLAEVLRQLPLSFFGNRDLTDLTTTIMGGYGDAGKGILPLSSTQRARTLVASRRVRTVLLLRGGGRRGRVRFVGLGGSVAVASRVRVCSSSVPAERRRTERNP